VKNLKETRLWVIRQDSIVVLVSTLIVLTCVAPAPGQLGMGDNKGIAQQKLKPTGKAELGTHLILKDKHGRELNIHLGPAPAVSETVKLLTVGTKLDLVGFRTDKMPPNQYVAKTLILANYIIHLRDPDLRPYWANNRLGEGILSSSAATTGKRKTSETKSSLYYYPRFWQRRCFQDGQRPCWRRRYHGRACGRKWK